MNMDEPINRWLAAARGVHLAACMLMLSVWIFDRWIAADAEPNIAQPSRRIGRWLLAIGLPAALFSGVAWFYFVADGMKDPDEPMRLSVLRLVWKSTQFGRVWQIRAILWIAAAIGLCLSLFSRRACSPRLRAWAVRGEQVSRLNEETSILFLPLLQGVIAVAFLASIAWAGHGATGPEPIWHRAADVAHLLVCAAWPIGLIPLGLLLWQRRPIPAAILRRFSAMSLGVVVILIGTGIVNSWCLVGSFSALWTTPYGRLLLLKLAIFLAVIALGAINLLRGKSRLPARRLPWIVAIEAVLGLGIMAIVGVLGLLMPARM